MKHSITLFSSISVCLKKCVKQRPESCARKLCPPPSESLQVSQSNSGGRDGKDGREFSSSKVGSDRSAEPQEAWGKCAGRAGSGEDGAKGCGAVVGTMRGTWGDAVGVRHPAWRLNKLLVFMNPAPR